MIQEPMGPFEEAARWLFGIVLVLGLLLVLAALVIPR